MKAYCDKCRTRQAGSERACLNCGAPYGGTKWVLFTTPLLLIVPGVVFIADGRLNELLDIRVLLRYVAPVVLGAAILYDYHPVRRGIYFWGGGAAIAASVFLLQR